jgi:outer membrane protein insertion porin family
MTSKRTRRLGPHPLVRSAIVVAACWAFSSALAFSPFVVRDIRIEGIQRTEPGTVFGYLPVRVGETLSQDKASEAIRALFATGFFRDVRLENENGVLVVYLEERPAIASVSVSGSKDIDKDVLTKALRDQGIAESRIFDRSVLERAEQEIKRLYLSRGRYAATVTSTITPLERNRVGVSLAITEGEVAKIRSIVFTGNKAFTDKQLLDQMRLSTPNWLSWYSKNDQYSREKLAGDIEALRSFYLNRGYLEATVDSSQVAISPDKDEIQITLGINEGKLYRVGAISIGGNLLGREDELRNLLRINAGETYSGQRVADAAKRVSDRLGELGYAFANINPAPEINRERSEVSFNFLVDPGRRVYVRRIEVVGNTRTRDEVIRREMRQFEDSWYDADKIRLSRERIDRLGYFKSVQLNTRPVAEAADQVDLVIAVEERPTGSIGAGIGFSSTERIILSASLNQSNFLGTGNAVRFEVNTSQVNRQINISFTDPYFTQDGISRSFDFYVRTFNAAFLRLGDYSIRTIGLGMNFGIPYTEVDRIFFGAAIEGNDLSLGPNPPQRFIDYTNQFGSSPRALVSTLGWRRDTRDSAFIPTRGRLQTANVEVALPVLDLQYLRTTYVHQYYTSLTRDVVLGFNADLGYGKGYGGKDYPLFKNFYAGGIGSVRGFQPSSLGGQRDPIDNVPLGGQVRVVGSVELQGPLPGTGNDRSFRAFSFIDAGNVYQAGNVSLGDLRFSTGVGISWLSPFGPMKFSLAYPLRQVEGDRTQRLQFQIGTGF